MLHYASCSLFCNVYIVSVSLILPLCVRPSMSCGCVGMCRMMGLWIWSAQMSFNWYDQTVYRLTLAVHYGMKLLCPVTWTFHLCSQSELTQGHVFSVYMASVHARAFHICTQLRERKELDLYYFVHFVGGLIMHMPIVTITIIFPLTAQYQGSSYCVIALHGCCKYFAGSIYNETHLHTLWILSLTCMSY